MNIDPAWQVTIGAGVAGLLINTFRLYKGYKQGAEAEGESQKLAAWSIRLGLIGLILFGIPSVLGIILGGIGVAKLRNKGLAYVGISISVLTALPWVAVIIWGP